jgi:hypothetical protein
MPLKVASQSKFAKKLTTVGSRNPLKHQNSSRLISPKPLKRKESASFRMFKDQIKKRKEKFLAKAKGPRKDRSKSKRDKSKNADKSGKFGLRKGSVLSDLYKKHKSTKSRSKQSSLGSDQDFMNLRLTGLQAIQAEGNHKGSSSAMFTP